MKGIKKSLYCTRTRWRHGPKSHYWPPSNRLSHTEPVLTVWDFVFCLLVLFILDTVKYAYCTYRTVLYRVHSVCMYHFLITICVTNERPPNTNTSHKLPTMLYGCSHNNTVVVVLSSTALLYIYVIIIIIVNISLPSARPARRPNPPCRRRAPVLLRKHGERKEVKCLQ